MDIGNQLLATWEQFVQSMVEWTPRVVIGLVLLIAAVVVAKLVERILRSFLRRMKFDALLARVGVDQALQKLGIRQSINEVIPRIVYFLLLVLFLRTGSDALGLTSISSAIGSFMGYLPNAVAALLILVIGSAAAQFASRTVAEAANSAGIEFAVALGRLVSFFLMFVIVIMAISQLKIDTDIVRLVTSFVLAGMALAFGISFGLGSMDVTRNILAGFYARKTFEMGEPLEVRGQSGILRAITPTQTLLEKDGRVVAVSNSVFLDEVVKQ